jgi:hypothetical protein
VNPFKYKPSQIAKAIIAALSSVVALAGLAAAEFTEGPLSTFGGYAAAVAIFLTPILVFLQKAEPWAGMLDALMPQAPPLEGQAD